MKSVNPRNALQACAVVLLATTMPGVAQDRITLLSPAVLSMQTPIGEAHTELPVGTVIVPIVEIGTPIFGSNGEVVPVISMFLTSLNCKFPCALILQTEISNARIIIFFIFLNLWLLYFFNV